METERSKKQAIWRGMKLTCPACGEGKIFSAYLKVADNCAHCGQALDGHRADDAPPYFTIFIVGHVIIPLMYFVERSYAPELWIHITLFGAIAIITSLISLPITKGGIVGLQWALRLHGFGETGEDPKPSDHEAKTT